jgi:hypothetical protein
VLLLLLAYREEKNRYETNHRFQEHSVHIVESLYGNSGSKERSLSAIGICETLCASMIMGDIHKLDKSSSAALVLIVPIT